MVSLATLFFLGGEKDRWEKMDIEIDLVDWAVFSDEQMRKRWPFSLLNDEQMSNKVWVKHQPVDDQRFGVGKFFIWEKGCPI